MPHKKHPRVGGRVGGGPQCLYCPKEFVAHFDPPGQSLIACKGLSLHTSQVGGGQACGEEYAAAGYMQNGGLKSHLSSPASKSLRASNVSSREVGLIETGDGPLGPTLHPVCQKVDHSLLNNQTLYDGRRPPLSRDNVTQAHSQAISSFETTTPTGPFEEIDMDSRGSSSGRSDDWGIIGGTAVIKQEWVPPPTMWGGGLFLVVGIGRELNGIFVRSV